MKKRYIFAFCLALPLLAGLAGCSSDDDSTSKTGSELLNAEGIPISRRTVAKYRGAMKIPGKAERAAFH